MASLWHHIGTQFRNPSGRAGALMGGAMRVINRAPNRLAVEALEVGPHDRVLELGCGPGEALAAIARLAPQGTLQGVDLSDVMLRQAARRNAAAIAQRRVTLHRASFEALPLADASIDRVLAVNVVYFWYDPHAVLTEIRRVLAPGGRLVLYATDASAMRHWRFASAETHRLFDTESLTDCLRTGPFAGCRIAVSAVELQLGIVGLIATIDS